MTALLNFMTAAPKFMTAVLNFVTAVNLTVKDLFLHLIEDQNFKIACTCCR